MGQLALAHLLWATLPALLKLARLIALIAELCRRHVQRINLARITDHSALLTFRIRCRFPVGNHGTLLHEQRGEGYHPSSFRCFFSQHGTSPFVRCYTAPTASCLFSCPPFFFDFKYRYLHLLLILIINPFVLFVKKSPELMGPATIFRPRSLTVFKSYQIPPHYVTNAKRDLASLVLGYNCPHGSDAPNLSALF